MEEVVRKRKKRKKPRKGLWIALSVIVLIAGFGWGGLYYMTHRDIQAEDIGVEQDFFEFGEFTDVEALADTAEDEPVTADQRGGDGSGNGKAADGEAASPQAPPTSADKGAKVPGDAGKNPGAASGEPAAKDKRQEIERKYTKVFKRLESTALAKLDTLAQNALADYKTGRSIADLSSAYSSAANKLQGKVDETFYSLLAEMKAELKANGYGSELAKKAEEEYEQAIASKKSELLGKVAEVAGK